jgi:hypothetical protein
MVAGGQTTRQRQRTLSSVVFLGRDLASLLVNADAAVVELEAGGLAQVLLLGCVLEVAADLAAALDAIWRGTSR